jgi:hypothetical protein
VPIPLDAPVMTTVLLLLVILVFLSSHTGDQITGTDPIVTFQYHSLSGHLQ